MQFLMAGAIVVVVACGVVYCNTALYGRMVSRNVVQSGVA